MGRSHGIIWQVRPTCSRNCVTFNSKISWSFLSDIKLQTKTFVLIFGKFRCAIYSNYIFYGRWSGFQLSSKYFRVCFSFALLRSEISWQTLAAFLRALIGSTRCLRPFWLAYCAVYVFCDWLEWFLWLWIENRSIKENKWVIIMLAN